MRTLLVLMLVLPAMEAFAGSTPTPTYLMASAGDSITAAFIANTVVGERPPLRDLRGRGDHKDTLSWATGEQIESHAVRLQYHVRNELGGELSVLNVAKSGAESDDLDRQADLILKEWNTGRYEALLYVTLLIGANDLCDHKDTSAVTQQKLETNVRGFLARLAPIRQALPIRVLVSSVPRIPDLSLPEIADHPTFLGATCRRALRTINACQRMIGWKTQDEYLDRVQQVEAANRSIRDTIAKTAAEFPTLQLYFSPGFYEARLQVAFMASDCFHPNQSGQAELARVLWQDQPWFSKELTKD